MDDQPDHCERARRPRPCEHQSHTRAVGSDAQLPAEHDQRGDRPQVEEDRGGIRRLELVKAVLPREHQLERHVREIRDRPVGVAMIRVAVVDREVVKNPERPEHRLIADVDLDVPGKRQHDPAQEQQRQADHERTGA